ncbi:MAG: alanine--glyoxylate aminotransferase family protein [Gemmatimonadota bacterium]|nr:alanine--glyoxylate aminotransferase family protein [Gemmatimonadota bacterium]
MSTTEFGTFFLPGPTEVRQEVLQAMTRPMISHRGPEFEQIFDRVQDGMRLVFGTSRPVYVGTCSATGFMEAGVRSAPEGRVLALVNGAFSERFAHIAESCGRNVERYVVEWGEAHDVQELSRRLGAGDFTVVSVAHSETSSGVLNDVRAISDTAHEHGAVCLVDSVSGIGGAELRADAWNLDYVLTGSQKALALPPGLAFAVASSDFIANARTLDAAGDRRGTYLDITEFEEAAIKHQVPNTPSISLYYALDVQLRAIAAEGMEARWARHLRMQALTLRWIAETAQSLRVDIQALAGEGYRSPTVTTIALPSHVSGSTVTKGAAARGITVGTGYGKLRDSTIRIGHMGDHTPATVARCLDACRGALEDAMG